MVAFLWLNRAAVDGYFQDDELDNIGWAPFVSATQYATGLLKPLFDPTNFRPVGHAYFSIMSRTAGLNFPPYIAPLFCAHLLNCLLVFAIARQLGTPVWQALAGAAFFGLNAAAMDVWWKPMYVFDLFCATFCLLSILLFARGRWVLSFVAFWLAYKSKELAVMLPLVLLAYEYWLGGRRFARLIPFFLVAFSFGVQGLVFNPNRNNDYTFRFTLNALKVTVPFYGSKLLLFRWSTLLLLPLLLLGDVRIRFALAAMFLLLFTLLFLPGRLFDAYFYLPMACAALAIALAFARFHPNCAWCFIAIWSIFNVPLLERRQNRKLAQDDRVFAFIAPIEDCAATHPSVRTLVFRQLPAGFHDWGLAGAWNFAHGATGLTSLYFDSPEARTALAAERVAVAQWDENTGRGGCGIHSPQ